MKKLILSVIALSAITISASAQIIVRGISPSAIAGNKQFTWADNWGQTPNFNVPGTFVQDTLAIVEDGTTGMSTTTIPHPLSQEGCNPLTNAAAVAGKIAVVYRGTCEFGLKALNAMNAGAVGVIIVNRDPEAIGMAGGTNGANVTIPVVMIGSNDGQPIKAAILAGPTVMFLGNKVGTLANDLVINSEYSKVPEKATVSNILTSNVFSPAVRVYNYGNTAQTTNVISLSINGPGLGGPSVYSNTATVPSIAAGDSVEVVDAGTYSFPTINLTSLAAGEYFMKYTAYSGAGDNDSSDNEYASSFSVNTDYISLARLDASGNPVHNSYPQNTSNPGSYDACMTFTNPNASEIMVTGVKFVPSADTAVYDMTGEEITFSIFEWTSPNDLTTIAFPPVYQSAIYLANNSVNRTAVYHQFGSVVPLVDDVVYLMCATSSAISNVVFGYDSGINYNGTMSYDILYSSPIQIAGTWYTGWSGTNALSASIEVAPNTFGLSENSKLEVIAFPNPTQDKLNLRVNAEGNATATFTDLSGKIVSSDAIYLANGSSVVNTQALAPGAYIVTITTENGSSTKLNVIKN